MTYSCAIFEPGDTLETAQRRKYEALAELADVRPGHDVLEIGTGWGGMAMHLAATRGCRVTSATISRAQASLARERIAAAGLADLIDVVLCDYREIEGTYDRIVSVEMFEAVGERYWPTFFASCDRYLRPGGAVGMQTITMPHRRYRATRRTYGWVHKYIFPGGLIPSEQAIDRAVRAGSGLRVEATSEIGRVLHDHAADVARALRRPDRRGRSPRLRRHVPADVGVLPGLLRGRVRDGRARQRPAAAGATVRLGGRRVWVTGASSGIGAALVKELLRRGCRVAASARRADRLEALGPRVVAVPLDVTDRDAVIAAEERVRAELGGIDVVVLNAAYWGQFTVEEWDSEVLRSHFDTNVMGLAYGVEAVLPDMRRRGAGTIVGVASVAGYRGFPRSEAYGATKAAEINMLEALRIDLRPLGITVQTVCPGFVRTDLTAKNTFPMPFMLEADDAARRICRGIEREKAEIVFPFPMMVAMKALRLVPVRLYTGAFGAGLRRGREMGKLGQAVSSFRAERMSAAAARSTGDGCGGRRAQPPVERADRGVGNRLAEKRPHRLRPPVVAVPVRAHAGPGVESRERLVQPVRVEGLTVLGRRRARVQTRSSGQELHGEADTSHALGLVPLRLATQDDV